MAQHIAISGELTTVTEKLMVKAILKHLRAEDTEGEDRRRLITRGRYYLCAEDAEGEDRKFCGKFCSKKNNLEYISYEYIMRMS